MIATRASEEETARECMRKAEDAARRIGADRNDFETEFGPTNVALHAVGIAVELGDAGEALRRAATVDTSGLSIERRARFLLDVARAYAQRRKVADTVRALEEAEALTPSRSARTRWCGRWCGTCSAGSAAAREPGPARLAQRVGVLSDPPQS